MKKRRESWIADKIDWEYRKSKRMKAKIEAKKSREAKEKEEKIRGRNGNR